MRIGIFDPYLDDLGGGEKYMISIASCLSKEHDVIIFWNNKEDLEKLQKRFFIALSGIKLASNIFSKSVSLPKRLLETSKFDVIIILSDGSIPLSLSKKLFIHIQQPLSVPINSLATKIKLSRINAFFYNSKYTKSFINQTIKNKNFVIYPPVELFPKEVKKENIILNVGRLRVRNVKSGELFDYKKQTALIEAFKEMVRQGLKEWKLVLAISVRDEDKDFFDSIKTKAMNFPIEFLVNKNNKELWEVYNKASIYWHASGFGEDLEKHPEYAEHFGISTVEAMGGGAVPVVINAGGQKEIVEDGVNGYLWDTWEALKEKTLRLVKDDKLWEKMSNEAKKRAEFFAGNRFCKEISDLLKQ